MDPYDVLQISRNASEDEIRQAYRDLVKKYHPDVNHSPDAALITSQINEAYDQLTDPRRHATYSPENVADETQQSFDSSDEAYRRWYNANKISERKQQERLVAEANAYRAIRKIFFVVVFLCIVPTIDSFLPTRTEYVLPLQGYQRVFPGKHGSTIRSYITTTEGELEIPNMVHVNYDYYADNKRPICFEYTRIFNVLKRVGNVSDDYIVFYAGANSPYTRGYAIFVCLIFVLSLVIIANKKYQPILLVLCLLNCILIVLLLLSRIDLSWLVNENSST